MCWTCQNFTSLTILETYKPVRNFLCQSLDAIWFFVEQNSAFQ